VDALTARDPSHLGDWELLARLAEGGMGVVYLARRDGQIAALKAVQEQLAWDEEYRLRFRHEVEALRTVRSPFVVRLLDADADARTPWLVMTYEPATSLDVTIRRSGPLQRFHGLRFLSKLAQGVAALHEAGIIHRDVKPSNVLVTDDGPRIIDLGIARVDEGSATGTYGPLTEAWSSPEQLDAHPEVSPATDVFNLGLVAGFALTGTHPFGRSSSPRALAAMIVAMCAGRPSQLENVDWDVRELVTACFAAASDRPSPEELARGFANLARGVEVDVHAGDFGTRLVAWHVPRELHGRGESAARPATTGAPATGDGAADRVSENGNAEVARSGSGSSEVSAPSAGDDEVAPSRPRTADPRGRFVVLPANIGWNPLIGLDDELGGALCQAGIASDRGVEDLRWSWDGHEFVLPLSGGLPEPAGGQSLWDWLDEQVRRVSLTWSRADVGGRLIHLAGGDELFLSLNPDVAASRPHFVVLETAGVRDRRSPVELGRQSFVSDREVWDEADEERLAELFLDGTSLHELCELFGRSARAIVRNLEHGGVVQPLGSHTPAAVAR
jgi:hypothetical protein